MENFTTIAIIFIALFLILLFMGWWIAFALGTVSVLGYLFAGGGTIDNFSFLAHNALFTYLLIALPVFILMGKLIIMSGITQKLYDAITPLLPPIPGGIMHVTPLANIILGAACGSTIAATSATTTVAVPELKRRGYPLGLAYGSLASAGCIAGLIPPSLAFILYSAITEVSLGQLFLAGIIPGILLGVAIAVVIVMAAKIRPQLFPPHQKRKGSLIKALFFAFRNLWAVCLLIILVLGTIYTGITTPTESGTIGVIGALVIAIAWRQFSLQKIKIALFDTIKITGALFMIFTTASVYGFALNYLGLQDWVRDMLGTLPGGPVTKMVFLGIFFLVLGLFIDSGSAVIITTPVLLPFIVSQGFSPLWYGVWLTLAVELGNITPPVGLTIFAVQAVTGESLETVAKGCLPFWSSFIMVLAPITFWPILVLWVPRLAFGIS